MSQTTIAPLLFWLLPLGAIGLVASVFVTNRAATRRLPQLGSPAFTAMQAGLPPSRGDDPALVRYARRTRRWRIGGTLAAIAAMVAVATLTEGRTAMPFQAAIVGWFAGGLILDLFARNRSTPDVRVAQLTTRSVLRYVTPTARRWLIASFGLTAVSAALSVIAGQPLAWRHDGLPTAAAVLLAAVGSAATWRIATRPQPAGDAADVQVDEAIRMVGTTRTISAWTALQFSLATAYVPSPVRPDWWFEPAAVVSWLALVGLIAAWAWVPTRIPRRPPTPSMVVAA